MVKPNGDVLIPCLYDFVSYFTDQTILVEKNNKFGILNRYNKVIVPCEYEKINDVKKEIIRKTQMEYIVVLQLLKKELNKYFEGQVKLVYENEYNNYVLRIIKGSEI
jgi:hypothetical protein